MNDCRYQWEGDCRLWDKKCTLEQNEACDCEDYETDGLQKTDSAKMRVHNEKNELFLKLTLLVAFIKSEKFKTLDKRMQKLLKQQQRTMNTYYHILCKRLLIWEDSNDA